MMRKESSLSVAIVVLTLFISGCNAATEVTRPEVTPGPGQIGIRDFNETMRGKAAVLFLRDTSSLKCVIVELRTDSLVYSEVTEGLRMAVPSAEIIRMERRDFTKGGVTGALVGAAAGGCLLGGIVAAAAPSEPSWDWSRFLVPPVLGVGGLITGAIVGGNNGVAESYTVTWSRMGEK